MLKDSVIIGYLANIFPDISSRKIDFHRIGGMSNINYLVDIEEKKYVLRIPGTASEGMVVRADEKRNSLIASRLNINPPIAYFDEKVGIKMVEYVSDAQTLDAELIQQPENLNLIASLYRKLHNSGIRLRNDFNLFSEIEKYNGLIKQYGAKMYEPDNIYHRLPHLERRLNEIGVKLCACHNDGVPENFLRSGNRMYLIDWEYSGMNDPIADLAALFLESEFSQENQNYILNSYFEHIIPSDTQERILIYQILWDYLWAQWTVIKESKGDDFGAYGRMRFERALKNIQLL